MNKALAAMWTTFSFAALLWATFFLVALMVSGCSNNSEPVDEQAPVGVTNEQSARADLSVKDEFVQNDEQAIDDQEIQPTDYGTFGQISAAITPLRWGRFITNVVRTVTDTVHPGDSIAVVHVHKEITGNLRVKAINGAGDTVVIIKPFTDNSDRNLIFKRVRRHPVHFWKNWKLVATSLVDGQTTSPAVPISLVKLQLLLGNGDTITVTDPLNYYLRYRWLGLWHGGKHDVPQWHGGAGVTLLATVVSSAPDTDLVALRFGVGRPFFHKKRMRMNMISEVNNGDGTYTRVFQKTFTVHLHHGFFHAAVDAVTRATLYDDATNNYSASWWGIPYRVH